MTEKIQKVVIAIDSFKGSLTSVEAGNAVKEGIARVCQAKAEIRPVADGGEGTTEALVEALCGDYIFLQVTGPMGNPVQARYGLINSGKTAVIEMAEAAGITRIPDGMRDPWKATTRGVGEMLRDAAGRGCRDFIIGIGGSATSDGGSGMLQALGYEFFDREDRLLTLENMEQLDEIERISQENVDPLWKKCRIQIACDVTNPLCGPEGAVFVYGGQKGIQPSEMEKFDRKLRHFANKTQELTGTDRSRNEGAGAAGGLGFAFLSYFPQARLRSGAELVIEASGLEETLRHADLVITGEGCMDRQTAMGKLPVIVAQTAKRHGKKVIALSGSVRDGAEACNEAGIDAIFPIVRGVTTLEEAMEKKTARKNIILTVEQIFRLICM